VLSAAVPFSSPLFSPLGSLYPFSACGIAYFLFPLLGFPASSGVVYWLRMPPCPLSPAACDSVSRPPAPRHCAQARGAASRDPRRRGVGDVDCPRSMALVVDGEVPLPHEGKFLMHEDGVGWRGAPCHEGQTSVTRTSRKARTFGKLGCLSSRTTTIWH
jgi:hypothetical protein